MFAFYESEEKEQDFEELNVKNVIRKLNQSSKLIAFLATAAVPTL